MDKDLMRDAKRGQMRKSEDNEFASTFESITSTPGSASNRKSRRSAVATLSSGLSKRSK